MSRYNLQTVSAASSFRNTYNRSTSSLLYVKSILASLVQVTADGSEQAQRHDEGRNQRNDPGRFMENRFQPQHQENSSKGTENSRPGAKFSRKSSGPPKREVAG